MYRMFFLLVTMVLVQSAGASQAGEKAVLEASASYTITSPASNPGSSHAISQDAKSAESDNGMEFVHVTGGCYCMGAAAGEGPRNATPVHQVCVDDYYIGKYEVTQAQWQAIMGNNPSTMSSCGENCPIVDVSWDDAQEFVRRLSERTGKIYRLPTEAEWEFAVRNGIQEMKSNTGALSHAAKRALSPVGSSQPNSFGIYDMQGSVWEWTADMYSEDYYKNSPTNNPEGPSDGNYRVLRGGSWVDTQQSIRATLRLRYEPWVRRPFIGLRLLSPDMTSAKYRLPDALAWKEKPSQNLQCKPTMEALIRQ